MEKINVMKAMKRDCTEEEKVTVMLWSVLPGIWTPTWVSYMPPVVFLHQACGAARRKKTSIPP